MRRRVSFCFWTAVSSIINQIESIDKSLLLSFHLFCTVRFFVLARNVRKNIVNSTTFCVVKQPTFWSCWCNLLRPTTMDFGDGFGSPFDVAWFSIHWRSFTIWELHELKNEMLGWMNFTIRFCVQDLGFRICPFTIQIGISHAHSRIILWHALAVAGVDNISKHEKTPWNLQGTWFAYYTWTKHSRQSPTRHVCRNFQGQPGEMLWPGTAPMSPGFDEGRLRTEADEDGLMAWRFQGFFVKLPGANALSLWHFRPSSSTLVFTGGDGMIPMLVILFWNVHVSKQISKWPLRQVVLLRKDML